MANQLYKETSPYLQQHTDNPVHWWAYCREAFEAAKQQDKPVFMSFGYSTCHWCHVMARESFSDQETADYMNAHFINIKIDREEYPGVDRAYQEMYQLLNRRGGGWPLSVWAHSDGSAFYIGTYFPNKSSFNLPSFMDVNRRIVEAWNNERQLLDQQATSLVRGLNSLSEYMYQLSDDISEKQYKTEVEGLRKRFDPKNGGIGGAPKFPRVSTLQLLLQESYSNGYQDIIEYITFTMHKMSKGGIYDQIGGGFARYSVDAKWLVPHFEKMLYDNAGLVHLGSELFSITKDPFIEWVVKDTINWLVREMRSPYGGFYSALNAESKDSHSVEREGAFYVWSKNELETLLGDDYSLAKLRFGISKKGNFDDPHHPNIKGMNILSIKKNMQEISSELKMNVDLVLTRLNDLRKKLFDERCKRDPPSTDTKIITSWNALLVKALYTSAELLDYQPSSKFAKGALDFLIEKMIEEDMVIRKYHINKGEQNERKIEGVLDDYSFLISALIQAFEYTDNWTYIKKAEKVLSLVDLKFYDQQRGLYFLNPLDKTSLIDRIIHISDDSMASGLAVMISNLFKLGKYLGKKDLEKRGLDITRKFLGRINEYSGAMNQLLISATNYLRHPTEVVVVGDTEGTLNSAHFSCYLPTRLVYRWNDKNKSDGRPKWDVLEGRTEVGVPTVFICQGMSCSLPITTKNGVIEELSSSRIKDPKI
ncbi:MAG: thioredoxin domain-containing protein [Candidatus Kariarchaeaceae archaeon]|jgi:uncharacterized protein YyaL (SSP411 family)